MKVLHKYVQRCLPMAFSTHPQNLWHSWISIPMQLELHCHAFPECHHSHCDEQLGCGLDLLDFPSVCQIHSPHLGMLPQHTSQVHQYLQPNIHMIKKDIRWSSNNNINSNLVHMTGIHFKFNSNFALQNIVFLNHDEMMQLNRI